MYDLCIFAAAVQQPVPVAASVRRHGVLPQAIDCRPGAGVPAAVRRGRHGGTEPAGGAQPAAGGAHYEKDIVQNANREAGTRKNTRRKSPRRRIGGVHLP